MMISKKIFSTLIVGLYLFLLPWDVFLVQELGVLISPSFLFLGSIVLIYIHSLVYVQTIRVSRLLLPLFFLISYSTLTLTWTTNQAGAIYNLITIWSYFITLIIVIDFVNKMHISVKKLLWFYIIGTLSIGVFSIIEYGMPSRRLTITPDSNPTMYAAFLVWSIVASLSLYRGANFLCKLFLVVSNIVMVFLLLLTQGRNSILALIISLPIALFIYYFPYIISKSSQINKNVIGMFLKTIIIASIIITSSLFFIFETGSNQRMDNIASTVNMFSGDSDAASVTSGRTTRWGDYLSVFSSTGFFGGGGSSAHDYYGELPGTYQTTSPHNVYILVLVEFGVAGILLWLTFIFGLIKFALQNNQVNFSIVWLSFIFLFLGIGNDILYYKYWWQGLLIFLLLKELVPKKFIYKEYGISK